VIAIVKIENGDITGWIVATDIHEARRQAAATFQNDLAEQLYRMELDPGPGKMQLGPGVFLLVT